MLCFPFSGISLLDFHRHSRDYHPMLSSYQLSASHVFQIASCAHSSPHRSYTSPCSSLLQCVQKKSMSILYAKSTSICTSLLNTIPTPPHHLCSLHLHVCWSQLHSALFPLGTLSTTFKTRHNCKQLFTIITVRSVVSQSLLSWRCQLWGSPYKFKGAGRVWRSGVKGNFVRRRGGLAPANFAG